MPTKTATPKAQMHDALVYKNADEIENITADGKDVFIEYWECCAPSERPAIPPTGTFRPTGEWEKHGLNSKRIRGDLIGDHLTKPATLIVGPRPPEPRKRGKKKEERVPMTRVSLYTTPSQ